MRGSTGILRPVAFRPHLTMGLALRFKTYVKTLVNYPGTVKGVFTVFLEKKGCIFKGYEQIL